MFKETLAKLVVATAITVLIAPASVSFAQEMEYSQLPTYNIEALGEVEIPEGFEYYKTSTYYKDGVEITTSIYKPVQNGRASRNMPSVWVTTTRSTSAFIPPASSLFYSRTIGGVLHTGNLTLSFYTRYGGVEQRYRRETWGGFVSPNNGMFSAKLD